MRITWLMVQKNIYVVFYMSKCVVWFSQIKLKKQKLCLCDKLLVIWNVIRDKNKFFVKFSVIYWHNTWISFGVYIFFFCCCFLIKWFRCHSQWQNNNNKNIPFTMVKDWNESEWATMVPIKTFRPFKKAKAALIKIIL